MLERATLTESPNHKKVGLPKWQILFGKYLDTSSLDWILAKLNSVHLVLISFPRCLANVPTINFMLPKYSQISLSVRVCSISCSVISHDDPERVALRTYLTLWPLLRTTSTFLNNFLWNINWPLTWRTYTWSKIQWSHKKLLKRCSLKETRDCFWRKEKKNHWRVDP